MVAEFCDIIPEVKNGANVNKIKGGKISCP